MASISKAVITVEQDLQSGRQGKPIVNKNTHKWRIFKNKKKQKNGNVFWILLQVTGGYYK